MMPKIMLSKSNSQNITAEKNFNKLQITKSQHECSKLFCPFLKKMCSQTLLLINQNKVKITVIVLRITGKDIF